MLNLVKHVELLIRPKWISGKRNCQDRNIKKKWNSRENGRNPLHVLERRATQEKESLRNMRSPAYT